MKTNTCLIALMGAAIVAVLAGAAQQTPRAANRKTQANFAPAATPPIQTSSITNASGSSELPLIVQLEQRDKTILIKAGTNGPVYFVKSKAGKVLVQDLSDKELQAYDPKLHQFIKTAVAGGSIKDGRYLDAIGR